METQTLAHPTAARARCFWCAWPLVDGCCPRCDRGVRLDGTWDGALDAPTAGVVETPAVVAS